MSAHAPVYHVWKERTTRLSRPLKSRNNAIVDHHRCHRYDRRRCIQPDAWDRGISRYLFLLPIVMTAYFFPRYGIAASVVMGLSLVLLDALFVGENLQYFSLRASHSVYFWGLEGSSRCSRRIYPGLKSGTGHICHVEGGMSFLTVDRAYF